MIVYTILARKNSKRLKNKNLLKIKGKSLVEIAIEQAINSKYKGKIIINSDIVKLKKYHNNKDIIFIKREKELSGDNIKSEEVLLDMYNKGIFNNDDTIVLLQPTSPLRKKSTIYRAIRMYKKYKKPVIGVSKLNKNIDNVYICINSIMKKYKSVQLYKQNGVIYVFSVKELIKLKKIPDNKFLPLEIDFPEDIDIDTKYEFDYVKNII